MENTDILLLHKGYSSFVRTDEKLLKKFFNVTTYYLKPSKSFCGFFFYHFRFTIYMLFNFRRYKIIYTWFGDYHAFHAGVLSRIFRLKHIIIVGGNDAVSIPSIKYGVFFKNNYRSKLIKKAYRLADAILCVDESLIKGENNYAEGNNIVGLENFIPGISKKCYVVPTGYNAEYWHCNSIKKNNQVLSVGIVDSENRAVLKGFDLIVQLSKALPDIDFIFIGMQENIDLQFKEINNLKIINKVDQETLKRYYCQSKVYVQFSLTEGLPNTLCEAMLCKCIVVGSNVNGIPTLVRDNEFILDRKDVFLAKKIVQKALSANNNIAENNRAFIEENYNESKRAEQLKNILTDILN